LLFGCTLLAVLAGACGGGSSASRYFSVSWSVTDLTTGKQASCDQISGYGVDILQTDNTIVSFTNQPCQSGVMYSTSPKLQKGVYTGSLEILAPNGAVLSQSASTAFDATGSGEIPFTQSFQVDDVCSHNRYFSLAWSADTGNVNRPLSCSQTNGYGVRLTVTNPPGAVDMLSSCDDGFNPNWYSVSSIDNIAPGDYSVTATLFDASGQAASSTAMQLVTVGACAPGVVGGDPGVAFLVR
jgi:hypothetical protein